MNRLLVKDHFEGPRTPEPTPGSLYSLAIPEQGGANRADTAAERDDLKFDRGVEGRPKISAGEGLLLKVFSETFISFIRNSDI